MTIPSGWFLAGNSPGELSLGPVDHPDDRLFVWKDVRVIVSNHLTKPAGTVVASVAPTPAAFVKWFSTNTDFHVLQAPTQATMAGMTGEAIAVDISATANYGDAGCPANPHCVDFLKDPKHDPNGWYSTGGDAVDWLFFAVVHYPTGDHLLGLGLEVPSPADLSGFQAEVQPIIDSLVLPTTYLDN